MAAITINAAHQKEHVREKLKNFLTALFVSNRMRRVAAETEYARPRRIPDTRSNSLNSQ